MKPDAPLSPDDPRLSAYLLGELPAEEALVVEAQLRRSPEAQAELEDLRGMCDLLRESFAGELEDHVTADPPRLSVLPAPKPDEKVVAFDSGNERASRTQPVRIASLGALAAAVVTATIVLPRAVEKPGSGPIVAEVRASETETSRNVDAPSATGTVVETPASADGEAVSDALVSTHGTAPAEAAQARPLGSDPTITKVRFLSDDPVDLNNLPLPAELLSYLPEEQETGRIPVSYQVEGTAPKADGRHFYLDTDKFPDPDIVHNRVELTGGVFRVGGEQTRSLYRTEQRSDLFGRTSVILKGMVRLEAGEEVVPVIDEPDPSYDFGAVPVSWNPKEAAHAFPSGATLTKAPVSEDSYSSDIAERYVVRQQERVRRALALGEAAERLLESGKSGAAATQLEMALQLIPDAPVTAEQRAELEALLRRADAALGQ